MQKVSGIRTRLHKKYMWIFEHNFVADKAKIRRRAVARQVFSRSMQQNLPKRHVYTLVKTGSYIQKYVIDKKTGEWIENISPDNTTKPNQALAHAWKCPYHNGRMCIEMVRRLSTAS